MVRLKDIIEETALVMDLKGLSTLRHENFSPARTGALMQGPFRCQIDECRWEVCDVRRPGKSYAICRSPGSYCRPSSHYPPRLSINRPSLPCSSGRVAAVCQGGSKARYVCRASDGAKKQSRGPFKENLQGSTRRLCTQARWDPELHERASGKGGRERCIGWRCSCIPFQLCAKMTCCRSSRKTVGTRLKQSSPEQMPPKFRQMLARTRLPDEWELKLSDERPVGRKTVVFHR